MFARRSRYASIPLAAIAVCSAWGGPAVSPASPNPSAAGSDGGATTDFTQPLPVTRQVSKPTERQLRVAERRNGYGIEGRVLYRSRPIVAPRRFDLVGVAGEMHALELRVRSRGDAWTEWAESANGDPVYTGGSDEVQLRSRTVPIEGELHYVRLGDEALSAPKPKPTSAPRRGGVPKPKFIGRAQWGANDPDDGCAPREGPQRGSVKAGVIHHTVSLNDYSEAEAPGMVLAICRFHRNANGWNDIGYNAVVDRFGNLYQGRAGGMNRAIVGAHAEGHNLQTTGIASIGTHTDEKANAATRKALINYLAWKLDLVGIDATDRVSLTSSGGQSTQTPDGERIRVYRVLSHSDTNFTECAGTALRKQIPGIRRAVQERIDSFGGDEGEEPEEPIVEPTGGTGPGGGR